MPEGERPKRKEHQHQGPNIVNLSDYPSLVRKAILDWYDYTTRLNMGEDDEGALPVIESTRATIMRAGLKLEDVSHTMTVLTADQRAQQQPSSLPTEQALKEYFELYHPNVAPRLDIKVVEALTQHRFVPIRIEYDPELRQIPSITFDQPGSGIVEFANCIFANKEAIRSLIANNKVGRVMFDKDADYKKIYKERNR